MVIPLTEVFICPDVLVGVPEFEILEREEELKNEEKKTQKAQDHQGNETVWRGEKTKKKKKKKKKAIPKGSIIRFSGEKTSPSSSWSSWGRQINAPTLFYATFSS